MSRMLAAILVAVLVCSPFSPVVFAQEATSTPDTVTTDTASNDPILQQRLCERDGGTWNGTSCDMPLPPPPPAPDITPPIIAPHDDVSAQVTSGSDVAVIYIRPIVSDDTDGAITASCTPRSGTTFAIGTTTVTCTATDAAGNSATATTFNIIVQGLPEPEIPPVATSTDPIATTTPPTATTTPTTDTGTGTTTPSTTPDPSTVSDSSTNSGVIDPSQSDTDNTNFEDVTNSVPLPSDLQPIDASATSTEALAIDPLFTVATSTDGTGSKIGGTIFTGNATASTTVKNILNITKSNVDGPGVTNSSHITADTDNEGVVTTSDETRAFTGDNRGQGGEGDATIRTGRAVSSARILNVVNTNLFNSKGLVLFLNPQGGDGLDLRSVDLSYFFNGGVGASPTQLGCTILTCLNSSALSILNKNTATVDNNVYVRAATGGNAATSTKEGGVDIATGNAYASADVLNLVNTNFVNSKYLVLSFDNFGDLNDDIVLPDSSFFARLLENGASLPDLNSSSYVVNNTNDENFIGTTTAHALTGSNSATTTALGHGEVVTGKAYTSSTSYTAANQTRVGGSSVLLVFHVSGNWSGTVKGLPAGMSWRRTAYGIEIFSTSATGRAGASLGEYNSATFIASSTNTATVNTNVNVWAETGSNSAQTEDGTATIRTGDAYADANVVNMVNTNIVNRNWVFASFNIFGDWSGDIDFGGHSPNLKVTTTVEAPNPTTPGSDITYHFIVANNGDVDADGVVLSAAYDRNLLSFSRANAVGTDTSTGIKWDLGHIISGRSQEIIATARVSAPGLPAGFSMSLPVNATVSSNQRDQDDGDNTQRTTITVSSPVSTGSDSGSSGGGSGTGDPRDRGDRDRGGGGDTSGGGGGGGAPPPSGGGGGAAPPPPPPSGGGGGTPAPSGGGGGGSPSTGSPQVSSGFLSGGGGGGGGGLGGGSVGGWSADPKLKITKSSSFATTTLPVHVDYKVVITNDKNAGALYHGKLTDTLYDPGGGVMLDRTWDLDTVAPSDQITLTYTIAFAATSTPGIYHNVARVTGTRGNPLSTSEATKIKPFETSNDIQLLPEGRVLGVSTSNTGFSEASCTPLLTTNLRPGSSNRAEVTKLQSFLAQDSTVYPQGLVTGTFGPLTTAAVRSFQRKYADEILASVGLSSPTGLVYSSTIRQINRLSCGGVDPVVASGGTSASTKVFTPSTSSKSKAPAKAKAPVKSNYADSQSSLLNSIGGLFSKFRW